MRAFIQNNRSINRAMASRPAGAHICHFLVLVLAVANSVSLSFDEGPSDRGSRREQLIHGKYRWKIYMAVI
ncbi:unnamed protein product [Leptidea sinapis]|uniref:Uncharacterized protein n=1 Tax=Leptidea sinapis TaxID=189913 RepID=A0A5E4QVG7_9NEOP|nr:unnamed protein product [Leptidea sinapis]